MRVCELVVALCIAFSAGAAFDGAPEDAPAAIMRLLSEGEGSGAGLFALLILSSRTHMRLYMNSVFWVERSHVNTLKDPS